MRNYLIYGICILLLILITSMFYLKADYDMKKMINKYNNVKIENDNISLRQGNYAKSTFDELIGNNSDIIKKGVSGGIVKGSVITDVLETQYGSMSSYGPDCVGCSGRLGGGFDARSGSYYYNDSKFGNIRIVAGDRKYPYGTIVRINDPRLGVFNAIVLDRGGAIGIGRTFTFDLLCPSQKAAMSNGTSYNVKFEILRYGY